MNRILFFIFFILFFKAILVAQEKKCNICTLSLYTISNNELSLVVDSFIIECMNDPRYHKYEDSLLFLMDLRLYNNQRQTIVLSLIKYKINSDTIYIYENPYLKQSFVERNGFLIYTKINANYFAFSYLNLEEFIKKTGLITVCLLESPPDLYDIGIYGEIKYSDNLISWMIDFIDGKIHEIVKFDYADNE